MTNIKKWEDNGNWVEIDLDLCSGVSECVNICPSGVYILHDGKVSAENIGGCIQCMACQMSCPNNALLNHSAWE
jgi:NAD-dependent dihydropyrimidine dehydrogenase PreA subunit